MENEQGFGHDDFDFTAEIAAGVAWLDGQRPGWRDEVDAETLDMRMPNDCVLGQLYGNFWQCVGVVLTGYEQAIEHGFAVTGRYGAYDTSWEKLTMQWSEVLIHNAK